MSGESQTRREYGTDGMKRNKLKKEMEAILYRLFRPFPFVPFSRFLLSRID